MLVGKGVFPYEHLDSWEKMTEPPLPACYPFSRLNNEPSGESDYARANEVWRLFKCTSRQQYLELYLKTDVLLVADLVEECPGVCMSNYGL